MDHSIRCVGMNPIKMFGPPRKKLSMPCTAKLLPVFVRQVVERRRLSVGLRPCRTGHPHTPVVVDTHPRRWGVVVVCTVVEWMGLAILGTKIHASIQGTMGLSQLPLEKRSVKRVKLCWG